MNDFEQFEKVNTPAYIIDKMQLERNLQILKQVEVASGAKILLAQKCYSVFQTYPLIGKYISGCTASGLYEARLGHEEMGKENHVYSPAYTDREMDELLKICDHITFNSLRQWVKFRGKVTSASKKVSCGLRVNPEHSTQPNSIYDPCALYSRLGIPRGIFRNGLPQGIEGLHFHTLCEQNADALAETAKVFEEKFIDFLPKLKWLNMGGGHHITRPDYDIELLVKTVRHFSDTYGVQVYLEPGEAIALNAGTLVTTVLDLLTNGINIAILDTSAACHMPDVLEMPYRPNIVNAELPQEKPYTYRLGGRTCLAGDVIGDYGFDAPLKVGDRLYFEDMAIYTMVKNNTFNGMPLPDIYLWDGVGVTPIREFGYGEFKGRL